MIASDTALPPMRLGEIVVATARYDLMKPWYRRTAGHRTLARTRGRRGAARAGRPSRHACAFSGCTANTPIRTWSRYSRCPAPVTHPAATRDCTTCSCATPRCPSCGSAIGVCVPECHAVPCDGPWPGHEPVLPRSGPQHGGDLGQQLRDIGRDSGLSGFRRPSGATRRAGSSIQIDAESVTQAGCSMARNLVPEQALGVPRLPSRTSCVSTRSTTLSGKWPMPTTKRRSVGCCARKGSESARRPTVAMRWTWWRAPNSTWVLDISMPAIARPRCC